MNRGCGTARIAALSSAMIQIPSQGSGERRQAGAGAVLVSRKWSGKMFSPALMLSQVTLLHVTLRHKSHWYTWHNIDHSRPPISYFCACLEGTLPYSAQFDSVYLLGAVTHWRGRGAEIFFPAEAPLIIDLGSLQIFSTMHEKMQISLKWLKYRLKIIISSFKYYFHTVTMVSKLKKYKKIH